MLLEAIHPSLGRLRLSWPLRVLSQAPFTIPSEGSGGVARSLVWSPRAVRSLFTVPICASALSRSVMNSLSLPWWVRFQVSCSITS